MSQNGLDGVGRVDQSRPISKFSNLSDFFPVFIWAHLISKEEGYMHMATCVASMLLAVIFVLGTELVAKRAPMYRLVPGIRHLLN